MPTAAPLLLSTVPLGDCGGDSCHLNIHIWVESIFDIRLEQLLKIP